MATARAHPELGGIESHVAMVTAGLAGDYDIELVTTDRSHALPRTERVHGALTRRFGAYPRNRDYYFSPGLFWRVLRADYDLLHVQGVHTLVPPLAMLAAVLRRKPFVITFHTGGSSSAFRARSRGLQWRLLAPLLRRARVLIGVSRHEARMFADVLDIPHDRVQVIRNGGALPRPSEPVDREPGLIVSTGRLERYKGHHRAIEALPEILRTVPEARVRILGSGPYADDLHDLAARLGVADKVTIDHVPPVERARMAREVAAASVVTLLSDYEAHPVAVMEALTLDRPVVVLRNSGLTELAELGWVTGVAPDAVASEISAAITGQLREPLLPAAGVLPTWDSCVAELGEVYAQVLAAIPESSP